MHTPDILVLAAVAIFLAAIGLWANQYFVDRRQRLDQTYRYIGWLRRQNHYPADQFTRSPKSELLRGFLRSCLCVPETILGFDNQSQLTLADLSRLVTLWAALGADATICYGFVDEHKRHPFRYGPGSYATIWVEFRYEGEPWVYWYCNDASIVERRRDFYRHDAATILHDLLHDLRFADAGARLFKN